MSKTLKLVNLSTYVNPAMAGILMKKGETATFSDAHAAIMLKSGRTNGDNERVPYWEEVTVDSPTYNFDGDAVKAAELPVETPPTIVRKSQRTRTSTAA